MTLSILQQTIANSLQNINTLVDLHQLNDMNFIHDSIDWLKNTEEALSKCRSPLSSTIASERSKVLSVREGYRDPLLVSKENMSVRKLQMATTSIVLNTVQNILQTKMHEIDTKFDTWREKMSQFIALASIKNPIPLPTKELTDEWLQKVWFSLRPNDETLSMYEYLNSVMTRTDRTFILHDVIENILSNHLEK